MSVSPDATIHPAAVIDPGATIGPGCTIGPFCHIGPAVRLGTDVTLASHVVIAGDTELGTGCEVHSFAVLGGAPQDLKYKGEVSCLRIGARNRIREHVTMNTGTAAGGGVTRIGDDGLFMAGCHVAHDAQVGNRVVVVNNAAIGGHCLIGDDAVLGGLCGIHQRVRVGQGAIVGALTMVAKDVIPHGLVQGPRGRLDGLNLVGLRRRGVARDEIAALSAAFQLLAQGDGTFQDRARRAGAELDSDLVRQIIDFVTTGSDRSYHTPGQG